MIVQILVISAHVFIVADWPKSCFRSSRADRSSSSALPFLANYASAVLTETWKSSSRQSPSIARAGSIVGEEQVRWRAWVGSGLSVAAGIFCVPMAIFWRPSSLSGVSNRQRWRGRSSPVPALKALILVSLSR